MFNALKKVFAPKKNLRGELATAESSPEGIAVSGRIWLEQFFRYSGGLDSLLRNTRDIQDVLGPQERTDHKTAGLWRKRFEGVANRPYEVLPGGEKPGDIRAWEICQMVMDELPEKIGVLEDMAKAQLYGFSASEIIWEVRDGLWLPREMRPKRRSRFSWEADNGDYELRLLSLTNPYHGEVAPPGKFLFHRGLSDAENPYGMPEGVSVYIIQQVGAYGLTYWENFVRMFGAPYLHGKVTGNAPRAEKTAFLEAMEWFRRSGVMVTSGNQSVEFPSVSIPAGNNVHKEFQMYLDECAARIILGETLTTSAGEKGARSLGEVHQSVSERKFRGDCVRVEETFRRLFRLITMWNVGNGAKAPHLSFEFDDADDKLKRAQILEILWRSGAIPKDVRGYVSRYFGFEIDPDAAARLTAAGGNLPAEKPTMLAASETRLEGLSRALNGKLNVEAAAGAEDAAAEYMRVLEETLAGSPENETPDAFAARLAAGLDANEFSQDRLLSALASAGLGARDRAQRGE